MHRVQRQEGPHCTDTMVTDPPLGGPSEPNCAGKGPKGVQAQLHRSLLHEEQELCSTVYSRGEGRGTDHGDLEAPPAALGGFCSQTARVLI